MRRMLGCPSNDIEIRDTYLGIQFQLLPIVAVRREPRPPIIPKDHPQTRLGRQRQHFYHRIKRPPHVIVEGALVGRILEVFEDCLWQAQAWTHVGLRRDHFFDAFLVELIGVVENIEPEPDPVENALLAVDVRTDLRAASVSGRYHRRDLGLRHGSEPGARFAQQMPLIRNYLDYFCAFLDLLAHAFRELIRTVAYPLYSERRYPPPPVLVVVVDVARGVNPMPTRRDLRTCHHSVDNPPIER